MDEPGFPDFLEAVVVGPTLDSLASVAPAVMRGAAALPVTKMDVGLEALLVREALGTVCECCVSTFSETVGVTIVIDMVADVTVELFREGA